jgi:hypothetical protein
MENRGSIKIRYCRESGEAEVLPFDEQPIFNKGESHLWNADILKDIIFDLTQVYNKSVNMMGREYTKKRKESGHEWI